MTAVNGDFPWAILSVFFVITSAAIFGDSLAQPAICGVGTKLSNWSSLSSGFAGGILSNTPFRELLQAHRDYWKKIVLCEDQGKIPDPDVYIKDRKSKVMMLTTTKDD